VTSRLSGLIERNPRSALRVCWFASIQLETGNMEVGVRLFVAEIKHVGRSSVVGPGDFVAPQSNVAITFEPLCPLLPCVRITAGRSRPRILDWER
jgi:hypothetical protein